MPSRTRALHRGARGSAAGSVLPRLNYGPVLKPDTGSGGPCPGQALTPFLSVPRSTADPFPNCDVAVQTGTGVCLASRHSGEFHVREGRQLPLDPTSGAALLGDCSCGTGVCPYPLVSDSSRPHSFPTARPKPLPHTSPVALEREREGRPSRQIQLTCLRAL